MKELAIKTFLSISSFSGVLFFLFVGKKVDVPLFCIPEWVKPTEVSDMFIYAKHIIFFFVVLGLSYLSISFARNYLPRTTGTQTIKEIKPIEGSFLPVYIGLFVIALSFSDKLEPGTIILLIVLFIFWLKLDGISYFNPFLLLFGYRFYEAKSDSGTTFTLISKRKDIKITNGSLIINQLKRINNFTFLEY